MAAGIDPATATIPIAPAAHYHMGGVATDAKGRTTLPGLWAAGEVACTGLHGANRLASNSLLEAIVFGARVAANIAATPLGESSADSAPTPAPQRQDRFDEQAAVEELRDAMATHVGVVRDGCGLAKAVRTISRLPKGLHTQNMLTTALLIAAAAFARRESRGAHFRSDFPSPLPQLAHRSRLTLTEAQEIAQKATT
jgi:L-aspartate oxidase